MHQSIPMVDLKAQYERLRPFIDAEIARVIESAHFIRGPIVGEFECELAAFLDVPYVLGVANGTDALQVAMMALGIGPGDEVITPSFTFVATAEAARVLGATPVFVDVDHDTFNLDPTKLEQHITPRTKAIIPVHLFGQAAPLKEITAIGSKHGIPVIEDMAQAIGARCEGKHVGSFGDVGTISFFPSKNLGAYGDAGAVVTGSLELYERMKMIASHGSRKKYYNEIIGVNSRLDSLQAAILKAKLPYLEQFNSERAAAASRYDQMLEDLEDLDVIVPRRAPGCTHVFHQYTIRVRGGSQLRSELQAELKREGISTAVYYPKGLHQLPVNSDVEIPEGSLSVTETLVDEVLSLPIYPEISEKDQQRVVDALARAMKSLADENAVGSRA
ncbi:MAG: DegT/DnrJ/EryC1/StrS family aminotransferase [Rhodothermales bacterium]|nr:DegT/DnrJ/EryC1/StrS family aminotransferase [Rhodothermales bacterium]